jgi:hypothetical protein
MNQLIVGRPTGTHGRPFVPISSNSTRCPMWYSPTTSSYMGNRTMLQSTYDVSMQYLCATLETYSRIEGLLLILINRQSTCCLRNTPCVAPKCVGLLVATPFRSTRLIAIQRIVHLVVPGHKVILQRQLGITSFSTSTRRRRN